MNRQHERISLLCERLKLERVAGPVSLSHEFGVHTNCRFHCETVSSLAAAELGAPNETRKPSTAYMSVELLRDTSATRGEESAGPNEARKPFAPYRSVDPLGLYATTGVAEDGANEAVIPLGA